MLEVGTGVGVGIAWMTVGLAARSDVEVISIEDDARLRAAARSYSLDCASGLLVASKFR